jgi:VWFA-related protein
VSAAAAAAALLSVSIADRPSAQTPIQQTSRQTSQQTPTFRSRVDLRQLDVTVLDKNRRPVRGLTADDFVLTEDGVRQKIQAFSFVDMPTTIRTEPRWRASAASGVVVNDLDGARVFVLLVDDVRPGDLWARRELIRSVGTFARQLAPDDIAAVVFSGDSRRSQIFTRDKARLAASAEWLDDGNNMAEPEAGCDHLPRSMLYIARTMAAMKNKRKVIVVFSGALDFTTFTLAPCQRGVLYQQVVQVANENNISIYPVDTMGLRPAMHMGRPVRSGPMVDVYISLAHHAGGHALINLNSFDDGLRSIFEENTSYYLLAYEPTNPAEDGRFRRVSIKVNRPDVDITSSRNYWAPKAADAAKARASEPPAELASIAGVLPSAELPLRATAAAFRADGDGEQAAAAVALAVQLQSPAFASRTRENVDLLVHVFTPDGIDYGEQRELLSVTVPAARAGDEHSRYEVATSVNLPKPGRYELRISAHSDAASARGSIYVDVDVPDYGSERLSMSGIVVSALPGPPAARAGPVTRIAPLPPTVSRSFGPGDLVTTFARIYQGGRAKLAPIEVKTWIRDANDRVVFENSESVPGDRFEADRSAALQQRLRLADLRSGEYLLTIEASLGKATIKRDVQFAVR